MLTLLVGIGAVAPAAPDTAAGALRLCADPDNLPFSSAAPGERGLYVDLAELVAARLGMPTEYTWWYTFYGKRAVRNTLLADRCDAFFGLPHDADFMGASLILTRPFLDVGWVIIAPARVAFSRVDDLKSRRLGVVFRSTPQLLLAARGGFQTATFRTDEEALESLGRGEIEAAFAWGPTAGYHNAKKLGGTHRVVPVGEKASSGARPWPSARTARRCATGSTARWPRCSPTSAASPTTMASRRGPSSRSVPRRPVAACRPQGTGGPLPEAPPLRPRRQLEWDPARRRRPPRPSPPAAACSTSTARTATPPTRRVPSRAATCAGSAFATAP